MAISDMIKNANQKTKILKLKKDEIEQYFQSEQNFRRDFFGKGNSEIEKILDTIEKEMLEFGIGSEISGEFYEENGDIMFKLITEGQQYDLNLTINNSLSDQMQEQMVSIKMSEDPTPSYLKPENRRNNSTEAPTVENQEVEQEMPSTPEVGQETPSEPELQEVKGNDASTMIKGLGQNWKDFRGQNGANKHFSNFKVAGYKKDGIEQPTYITGVDFTGSTFDHCEFKNVVFVDCIFDRCTFGDDVKFDDKTKFLDCQMHETNIPYEAQKGSGITFENTDTRGVNTLEKNALNDFLVRIFSGEEPPSKETVLLASMLYIVDQMNQTSQIVGKYDKEAQKKVEEVKKASQEMHDSTEKTFEAMQNKGLSTDAVREAVEDTMDIAQTVSDEALDKAQKADLAKSGDVEHVKDGKIITQEVGDTNLKESIEATRTLGEIFKEQLQLNKEMRLAIVKGIGEVRKNIEKRLGVNQRLEKDVINRKMDPQIAEVAKSLEETTKKIAEQAAERDYRKEKSYVDKDGSIAAVDLTSKEYKQIDRLQAQLENLVIKKATMLMKPIRQEINLYKKDQRADATDMMLARSITEAVRNHPEIFRDGHFVLNNELTLNVSQNNGVTQISIDRNGNEQQITPKEFNGLPSLDFSPYISDKEKEALIKAIIEDCEVQEPHVKHVLGHTHSLHKYDPEFATASQSFDETYIGKTQEMYTADIDKLQEQRSALNAAYFLSQGEAPETDKDDIGDGGEDIGEER